MPSDAEIEAAAKSDCDFDGYNDFSVVGRHIRERYLDRARLALEAAEEVRQREAWQPIASAPRDGTLVLLLVAQHDAENSSMPTEDELAYRTIGHNNHEHDGDDTWRFAGWCWSHDHYVEGRGNPTHWQPLPSPPHQEDER